MWTTPILLPKFDSALATLRQSQPIYELSPIEKPILCIKHSEVEYISNSDTRKGTEDKNSRRCELMFPTADYIYYKDTMLVCLLYNHLTVIYHFTLLLQGKVVHTTAKH